MLSLILGRIKPRWSIVARFPEKMPPIPPLMVRMGGKRARIHVASWNRGANMEIRPPAKRLIMLNERAIRV